ncbi:MAG: DUF5676 family membrane protein [Nanoarchaeota archaeon]
MAKLNANVVALSLGLTSAILYAVCLIIVAIVPVGMMGTFANNLQHSIDFSGMMTKSITLAGSVIGIIAWFFIAAVSGYIFALVYNWVSEKL